MITTSVADLSLSHRTSRDNKKMAGAFQALLSNRETSNELIKASAVLPAPTFAAIAVHVIPLPKQEQGHGELITQAKLSGPRSFMTLSRPSLSFKLAMPGTKQQPKMLAHLE